MERLHVPMAEPLFLELQHFIDAILNNRPPLVSALDGLQALQLATAIRTQIYQELVLVQPPQRQATAATSVSEPSVGWRNVALQPS
jgi:hypothetical protein